MPGHSSPQQTTISNNIPNTAFTVPTDVSPLDTTACYSVVYLPGGNVGRRGGYMIAALLITLQLP